MIFILLIGFVVFSSTSGRCPDGFVTFGLSCYYFSNDVGTWTGSQVVCSQAFFPTRAYLVEINNQAENNFLFQQAVATKKNYWVGASDLQITGMYRWIKSGKVVNATIGGWAPGNPSGGVEHCMTIWNEFTASTSWNDVNCNWQLDFICEAPAE